MSNLSIHLECADPNCAQSGNSFEQRLCRRCRKPLVHRYLWAVESGPSIAVGERVGDRYIVVAPQIWLDTQPGQLPAIPTHPPDAAVPYLKLRSHHLHIPSVFGICEVADQSSPVLLLEDAPITTDGRLHPAIASAWGQATPTRRLYWLWQLFQLWLPLSQLGAAVSLYNPDNIRVDGWRVQLREVVRDFDSITDDYALSPAGLGAMADLWLSWVGNASDAIAQSIRSICYEMQSVGQLSPVSVAPNGTSSAPSLDLSRLSPQLVSISHKLNQLLLEQASQQPLRLRVAGGTTTGPQRSHNEDVCYPNATESNLPEDISIKPRVAMICDGIGGHAGGEVASRLAMRSLKLQLSALLLEVAEQAEILPPEIVTQQLEAILRIANNMIAAQNDNQGRTARQRMATTVVLALQLPQRIRSEAGDRNSHELYLAHIGDSRAYWLTDRYCHALTLDHDVANRETALGHHLYRAAQLKPDSGALTQALGTRDADFIHPTVQRFILEEDGVLLLCSDGLSDNQWVETLWEHSTQLLLKDKMPLDAAVRSWLELANQRNGHDNASVVMMDCRVSAQSPQLFEPTDTPPIPKLPDPGLSATSRALLYPEDADIPDITLDDHDLEAAWEAENAENESKGSGFWGVALTIALLCFLMGGAGWLGWRYVQENGVRGVLRVLQEWVIPEESDNPVEEPSSTDESAE
jgi:protein phosphatase